MWDYQEDDIASEIFIVNNQFNAGLRHFYNRIEEVQEPDHQVYLELLCVKYLLFIGRIPDALEILDKYSLKAEEETELTREIAHNGGLKGKWYHLLGVASYKTGRYFDAQENLERSLEIKKQDKTATKTTIAESCLMLSRALTNIGDYDQALLYTFRVILPLYSEPNAKDDYRLVVAFIQLSRVYRLKQELKQAQWSLQQAERILLETKLKADHVIYADLYNNQGLYLWEEGKNKSKTNEGEAKRYWKRAKAAIEKGIVIADNTFTDGTHPESARMHDNLAIIHTSLEEMEEAHENYRNAIRILKNSYSENHPEVGRIYNNKGYLYRLEGNYEMAQKSYQYAMYVVVKGFRDNDVTIYHRNPVIELNNIDSFWVLMTSLSHKAALQLRIFEKREEIEYLEYARRTLETLFELLQKISKYFFLKGTKFSFEKHARRFCETVMQLTEQRLKKNLEDKKKIIEFAYNVSEFTRTVSLLEDFRERQIVRSKIKGSTWTEYHKLEKEIKKFLKANVSTKVKSSPKIQSDSFRIHQKFERWILKWKKINTESLQFQLKNSDKEPELRTDTLWDMQDSLDDYKGALISYFVGNKATYAFMVCKRFAEFRVISNSDKQATLLGEIEELKDILKITKSKKLKEVQGRFIELGKSLYQQLFKPLEELLPGINRIYLLPDGVLEGVPFEVLLEKDDPKTMPFKDLSYLLKRKFVISYHYSAAILRQAYIDSPALPIAIDNKFLGIAPVNFNKFKDLKGSGTAVEKVADLFRPKYPEQVTVLTKKKATLSGYEVAAKSSKIIHFVSHITNTDCIHLADNEEENELGLEEIIRIAPLEADLVFLCGCTSGAVSSNVRSISLDRAFLTANANNIVCTVYDIKNASTTHDLVYEFYKNVLDGNTYAESLKLAKLAALGKEHHELPIRWSGFLFIGDHMAKL